MGAGSGSGAGLISAGADPAVSSGQVVGRQPPRVALFDLQSRSFPRDEATGKIKLIHWVDQAVALAMGVTVGALKAQPGLGNRIRLIKRAAGASLRSNVEDAVRVALTALNDRGDIAVTDLFISTQRRSQIIVVLSYVNLRTMPDQPRDMTFIF